MGLQISETWIDRTRDIGMGESGWYEPWTSDRGRLYRELVKEHGRCTGKVYVDRKVAATSDPTTSAHVLDPMQVGWCFVKRARYDDTRETYLCETWVTVRED